MFIGSLVDNTLRLEMDNPIFHRLQDAIEWPCRSKDWFGMAEQAINTIYALGEHPDTLCNNAIKNLTRRVFSKPAIALSQVKDADTMDEDPSVDGISMASSSSAQQSQESGNTGDAFELSQLLFVVGHVAIKHIVFLELIEREWKRQKDEREKGKLKLIFTYSRS